MYTGLRKLSILFFALGAVFTVFAGVITVQILATEIAVLTYGAFTTFCIVFCLLALPGLFFSIGIVLHLVNQELFESKLLVMSLTSSKETKA